MLLVLISTRLQVCVGEKGVNIVFVCVCVDCPCMCMYVSVCVCEGDVLQFMQLVMGI